MQAQFIVIEGIEGAGKSTAIEFVKKYLTDKNIDFIQTREPGGTELAEGVRDLLKKHYSHETVDSGTEVLLLYAARLQLINNIIKPALQNNTWVVGDRHDHSTIAYQAGGRGVDEKTISFLKQSFIGDFGFDLCIYLDIDPKLGLERAKKRGELDRIEQEDVNFFQRVRDKYLTLAKDDPKMVTIDSSQSLSQVEQDIYKALSKHYG